MNEPVIIACHLRPGPEDFGAPGYPDGCSDPPGESCSDAGCPIHGGDYDDD